MSSASPARAGRRGRGQATSHGDASPAESAVAQTPAAPASRRRLRTPTPRVALLIATAILLGVVLYMGRAALTPFLIGLVLVYILDPPVRWLVRRGVPAVLAVLAVYAVTFVVLAEGLSLLVRPLVDQLATFMRDLPVFLAAFDEQLRRVNEIYSRLALPEPLRAAIERALAGLTRPGEGFDPTTLLPIARTIAGTVASIFGFLIVPVWAFYILKDRDRLIASFDRALPEPWREDTWAILRIVERVFGQWLRGQLFLGLTVGGATFLGLLLLGNVVDGRFLQFAVLLAVVAGLFELLPIIGPILSAVPALLIALTISPEAVIAVIALYTIVQQVENNVLVPKIQGDAVDLHPAVVIFALVIGGAIGGLLGAIFSLPITAAGRDVYRYLFRRLSDEPMAVPVRAVATPTPAAAARTPAPAAAPSTPEITPQGTRRRAPRRVSAPRASGSAAGEG
jgi:predicted PurR-regulated permease PerM